VDKFQVEQGASDLTKAKRRGCKKQAISKRENEVPLIVEETCKRLNSGPLAKMFDRKKGWSR
jgi:hypothetical protein